MYVCTVYIYIYACIYIHIYRYNNIGMYIYIYIATYIIAIQQTTSWTHHSDVWMIKLAVYVNFNVVAILVG